MSTFNPFRANPLSPTSTGASVNTVTSYNPPPSFHSVAGDDETTVFFDVDELPVISEEAEGEGSELSRAGTVMSTGTVREESVIDLEHSLPPTPTLSPTTPEIRIQVEEPALPPLPLSPRSTGSGTRNGAADDNADFPVPEYQDELPPAYTLAPDFNQGEETLELGPRRPFQQPQLPRQSAPTPTNLASIPTAQGNNSFLSSASPSPGPFTSRQTSSLNRRRGPLGALQQWTEQFIDQFEQAANASGVGNLRSSASSATVNNSRPSQGQAQQVPRHARSFSDVGSRTGGTTAGGGGRLSPLQPPLPSRLSPNPTGGSTRSANSVNTVNTRSSTPASTTPNTNSSQTPSIPSTANSDFARDFYAAGTGQGLHLSEDEDDDVPLGMRRSGSGLSAGASGDVRSRSSEGLGTSVAPNEPIPGHALLKDGKVLVYPKGFTCPICFNIGYKRSDPKHPCKKCWKKYAKPYSPVMSYAPDSGSTTTLQRPLPKPASPSSLSVPGGGTAPNLPARPNTLRRPSGPTHSLHRATPSVPNLHAASSTAYGSNTMPGSYPSPVTATPTGCTHPFHSMGPTSLYSPSYIQPQQTGGGGASAVVYSAGDPRLGGRLCWQCGGAGRVSYLFFDNSVCMECSGIGRVYR
ncbi:hypothetical protein M378DRAFT_288679 [Amanita muscaria Koide BX008]|uniref:Uncharacterized protein n=1 Tax=Amanita muscaria (strain Koide BX008) TaxID=946122 RepID=A0A0C2WRE2_AMAMK|nr:hypothetical protein M378DRAFT_288679 [Amanita muscaria Koide BX008]